MVVCREFSHGLAVRRIFDFFPAKDSDYCSVSDPYLKVCHARSRDHRLAAMPSEIGCGEVPFRRPHAFDDRAFDDLHPLREIIFRLHIAQVCLTTISLAAALG
jgi:hypothetical protein